MYHHRFQPPSHLANKSATTFDNNNYSTNSSSANSSNKTGVSIVNNSSISTTTTSLSSGLHHQNSANNNGTYTNTANSGNVYNSGLPKQFIEERQDVIFRRVRGILNKITPETFDKLSKELVNVGLDSPRTLRGVIYLLFDKALKDLKYSSLYAKLCQELSEKAPNFEQEPGPNTFCKFLISKCEDEFERRRKATEDFDSKNEFTDEEFEQKVIAKQKMLGNIKFICELGKKRLLQEEILHECIRGLLSKKKERPLQDQAQDLECLCQIMRTIGSLLDIQASRNLMNQYFERIDMFSKKPELPSRIRFMLRDVIDLRNNNWRPRPFQREDNVPQPLSKLREEAGYDATTGTPIDKMGNNKNLLSIGDLSKLHGGKLSSLLVDDEPGFTSTTDFHWGPTFLTHDTAFDMFASGVPFNNKNNTPTSKPTNSAANAASAATVSNLKLNSTTVNQTPLQSNNIMTNHLQHRSTDPFSDSAKARFNHNRPLAFNSNGPPMSHNNNAEIKRFNDRIGFEGGECHYERENGLINHLHDRDSGFVPHYKDSMYNTGPVRVPVNRNEVVSGSRRFDQPRPQVLQAHHGDNIKCHDPEQIGRPTHDMPQPASQARNHQPHPPSNHPHPNQLSAPTRNPRLDQRNMHGPDRFERERRSNYREPDHFVHEPRQPRFSGANYRLPGRDRPSHGRAHQNSIHQREAELNSNWRSACNPNPSSSPKSIAENRTDNILDSSNQTSTKPSSTFQRSAESNHAALRETASRRQRDQTQSSSANTKSEEENIEKLQSSLEHNPDRIEAREAFGRNNRFNQQNQQKNDDLGSSSLPRYPDSQQAPPRRFDESSTQQQQNPRPPMRRNESRQTNNNSAGHHNYKPGPRMAGNGHFQERDGERDRDKRSKGSQHEHDRPPTKSDQEPNLGFERNYKSPMRRNHSMETNNETNRASNWRKEAVDSVTNNHLIGTTNSNFNPKDHTTAAISAINTPNFPKPSSKISDPNFSLRPSHNLIGRTVSSSIAVQKQVPQSKETETVVAREPIAEIRSNVLMNNVSGVKQKQENAQKSSILPPKMTTDESAKGEKESQLEHLSSSRNGAQDFHVNKFIAVLSEYSNESPPSFNRIASKVKDLKIPKSYHSECIVRAMKQSIIRTEKDRENTSKLLVLIVPSIFEASALLCAFKSIFDQLNSLEVETPRVKSLVAGLLSRAVYDGLLTLEEVSNILHGGKNHPLFLLFLQKLEKKAGQSWLCDKFSSSKINLMDMLPEVDRTNERLATALKDRCLGFLDPMLTIEPDLWLQMRENDPSPASIYRWIKDNVDPSIQNTPTFAHVLIACLLRYIHSEAQEKARANIGPPVVQSDDQPKESDTEGSQSKKSSPTTSLSQSTIDIEKDLLVKYQQVLQAILKDKKMQLATLYALQSFYYKLDFPKGALLRWFHMLYDMNIVDDDVFFIWKEEINDDFPGKGQALFQVNTWLNWLAEAESEEEEEEV